MTTNSGQTSTRERIDPMLETLIKGLIETGSYPKAASRAEDAVTAALTEAYMVSLITPAGAESQVSPFKTAMLAATLAPALAEVLAPALAEALAPAIVTALNNIVSQRKTGQESASSESSDRQQ